jgi:hypothetical protein
MRILKKIFVRSIFFLLSSISLPLNIFAQPVKYYTAEKGAIVGRNTGRYNNRPLYINNTNAFILTGDQPIAVLARAYNNLPFDSVQEYPNSIKK